MKDELENLILIYGISEEFPDHSKAFKQIQLQDIMSIPLQKPDILQVISISVKVVIDSTNIISTTSGKSCEGQIIASKKLVIEGKIQQKLEYIADLEVQPIHAAHFCLPFSSFIVLGEDIECHKQFEVTGYIEDVYIKQLDKRSVFKNVLLLLNAVPVLNI